LSSPYLRVAQSTNVVIKLGTRLLTFESGKLDLEYLEKIVRKLSAIKNKGVQITLVSSGAIGAGVGRMNMRRRPHTIPEKQAAAAVGQGLLIQMYEKFFSEYGHIAAQILLTRADLRSRQRYINAANTISNLLKWGVIPVINENDTVSTEEIEFGDNDQLAALVSGLIDADLLINLTDTEGLYEGNPSSDPEAKLVPLVEKITPEIKEWAGSTSDALATGGMIAKINAAEIAINSGVNMVIANGRNIENITDVLNGEPVGTLFMAQEDFLCRRKRWIAYGKLIKGNIYVDNGARDALLREGKSLLPVGVQKIDGEFERGDLVRVVDQYHNKIARGLVNFHSHELAQIIKMPSHKISGILGGQFQEEVIHRDNLVTET